METVVLTFEKPAKVEGNIFATLSREVEEDTFARDRAEKINQAIFKKVNSITWDIVENIIKKIDVSGIRIKQYASSNGDVTMQIFREGKDTSFTKFSVSYARVTQEKYPIYSEEFSIYVSNVYVRLKGKYVKTKDVSKIEEAVLGELKMVLGI